MADVWLRHVNLIELRTKHPCTDCNLLDQAEKQHWKSIVPAQALIHPSALLLNNYFRCRSLYMVLLNPLVSLCGTTFSHIYLYMCGVLNIKTKASS